MVPDFADSVKPRQRCCSIYSLVGNGKLYKYNHDNAYVSHFPSVETFDYVMQRHRLGDVSKGA